MGKCKDCNGYKYVTCPVCQGSKKDLRNGKKECTYCRGAGTVKCTACGGTGDNPYD